MTSPFFWGKSFYTLLSTLYQHQAPPETIATLMEVDPIVAVNLPSLSHELLRRKIGNTIGLLARSAASQTGETPLLLAAAKSTPEMEDSLAMKTDEETQIRHCFAQGDEG
nr:hypothetical protein Iba_chr03aCG3070 [Ipomoea batatas]